MGNIIKVKGETPVRAIFHDLGKKTKILIKNARFIEKGRAHLSVEKLTKLNKLTRDKWQIKVYVDSDVDLTVEDEESEENNDIKVYEAFTLDITKKMRDFIEGIRQYEASNKLQKIPSSRFDLVIYEIKGKNIPSLLQKIFVIVPEGKRIEDEGIFTRLLDENKPLSLVSLLSIIDSIILFSVIFFINFQIEWNLGNIALVCVSFGLAGAIIYIFFQFILNKWYLKTDLRSFDGTVWKFEPSDYLEFIKIAMIEPSIALGTVKHVIGENAKLNVVARKSDEQVLELIDELKRDRIRTRDRDVSDITASASRSFFTDHGSEMKIIGIVGLIALALFLMWFFG